ncbi:hypothetical protein PsYK624_015610 [Phanerochaete sordida]|uniref:Uncharacterized protein n=1 Tax=Phanerochaete sordida TaxID=48140 RepID=A0A9P3L991_9APHY|nr:hypothetical protein PsYK624_015610 [Phanerochaete sordida]
MAVGLDTLDLIGFVCEAFLYGAYSLFFIASVSLILSMSRSRSFSKVIIILHCLLFAACTLHFALDFNRFLIYTTAHDVADFGGIDNHILIAGCVVSIADFIGNLILVYRCWIIWDRNPWVVVIPFLTSTAALICSSTATYLVWGLTGHLSWSDNASMAPAALLPLGKAIFILPLCTNMLVTGKILLRLWWVSRAVGTASAARRAMHVVIESGLLYFLVQLIFVIVYCMKNEAAMFMIAVVVQTYGIASTLIIIHIGFGLSSEQDKGVTVTSPMSFSSGSDARRRGPILPVTGSIIELDGQCSFNVYDTYGRKTGMTGRRENFPWTVPDEYPRDMVIDIRRG